jgi:hypothetical protein
MMTENYIEYYIVSENHGQDIYKIDIGVQTFTNILQLMSAREDLKYFQKHYKEYHYGDTIYQNYNNIETRVFRKTPLAVTCDENKPRVVKIAFQRQKLSIINVPSNTCVKDICIVNHLVFRITNRIFLNMLVKNDMHGKTSHIVYLNYNNDDGVDHEVAEQNITSILDFILAAPIFGTCR